MRAALVMLALLLAGPAAAQQLGRLLLAPAQRAELERVRRAPVAPPPASVQRGMAGVPNAVAPSAPSAAPAPAPVPAAVAPPPERVEGWVRRQGGRGTVWAEGVPYRGVDPPDASQGAPSLLPEGALRIRRGPAQGAVEP